MGTGGAGNFQNDAAADLRAGFLNRLVADFELDLSAMEVEDTELQMGRIAILVGILQTCGGHPPTRDQVARWQVAVLAVYDEGIFALGASPAFAAQRRSVIVDTFNQLMALAR
jgi:hypothetical protein